MFDRTNVTFHRAAMLFDFGAGGVFEVEFPEQSLQIGPTTVGSLQMAIVPEPSTALLVAGGLVWMGLRRQSMAEPLRG